MTLTWEGEEGREVEGCAKAGDSADQGGQGRGRQGGAERVEGEAREGRLDPLSWLEEGKEKAAAGEDGKELRGPSVDWVTHMGPEAQGKVTEGSGAGLRWRNDRKHWLMATTLPPWLAAWAQARMGRQAWLSGIYKDVQCFTPQSKFEVSTSTPMRSEELRLSEDAPCLSCPAPFVCPGAGTQVTWVVPAAARGAPPPPGAIVEGGVPLAEPPALEGVRGQVADLQAGELAHEVSE